MRTLKRSLVAVTAAIAIIGTVSLLSAAGVDLPIGNSVTAEAASCNARGQPPGSTVTLSSGQTGTWTGSSVTIGGQPYFLSIGDGRWVNVNGIMLAIVDCQNPYDRNDPSPLAVPASHFAPPVPAYGWPFPFTYFYPFFF